MPKRPRSHQLEAEARRQLSEFFDGQSGWSINDLHEDYGEDLLVRIFQRRKATPLSFYVQSKSTDSIKRFRKPSGFSVSFARSHLGQWAGFWEPVFVTLYDSKSRKTYWECVQTFLENSAGSKRLRRAQQTITIDIPESNLLDKRGLKRIFNITKTRFQRHHNEKIGAEILMWLLEERAGLKTVEYDPSAGMLILKDRNKQTEYVFFGKMKEVIDFLAEQKISYNDLLGDGLKRILKTFKRDFDTGKITILDEDGTVKEQYATLAEWKLAERAQRELDPDKVVRTVRRLRRQLSKQSSGRQASPQPQHR